MSTDIYGVRVLDVDRDELRLRFQVFMVYYDTGSHTHPPVPDDLGFFMFLLWEGARPHHPLPQRGPLGAMLSVDTMLDSAWVDANARRFVSRIERVATRNLPPTPPQWKQLHDFYYERDGGWQDEDRLVQFEYDVWVTDPRWIEPLTPGAAWGTTMFPLNADTWTAEDAPHIPDLAEPAVRRRPFATATGDLEYDDIEQMEFSDDGRYLAICSDKGRVWVYDTADWSEVVHTLAERDWLVPMLMWVPGEHIVTVKNYSDMDEDDEYSRVHWAFDVRTRTETQAAFQHGQVRSGDGAFRISPNGGPEGGYDFHPSGKTPRRHLSHSGGTWDPIQCKVFSPDGARLFLGAQQNLYIVDPATAEVVDTVKDASERLFELASSPCGDYLAVAGFSRKLGYLDDHGERPHELCVWRIADKKIVLGRQMTTFVGALAWSPDGRWLAATLEPCDEESGGGDSELVVFRMGPADEPVEGTPPG